MSTTVVLRGFKEFERKLLGMPNELKEEIGGEVEDAARLWATKAKQDAPKDVGTLAGSITSFVTGVMSAEAVSPAEYSAYVEWGTKSRVRVPAELQAYASQFIGKGSGDYYDFLNAILDWVKRKGLARIKNSYTGRSSTKQADLLMVAEVIAFSIIRKGIHPHPYFFIQMPIVEKQLNTNVKTILNTPH